MKKRYYKMERISKAEFERLCIMACVEVPNTRGACQITIPVNKKTVAVYANIDSQDTLEVDVSEFEEEQI